MSGWQIHDAPAIHVTPDADRIAHDLDMDCICGPDVEFLERPLVIHHSLDGREASE